MKKITRLTLIENMSGDNIAFNGFTVRPGAFFGIAETNDGAFPAYWSGWISAGCIALYRLTESKPEMKWVDEEDVDYFTINCNRDFEAEYEEECERSENEEIGYEPKRGNFVPWFAPWIAKKKKPQSEEEL